MKKPTLLSNLVEGDTFQLFSDGCVWTLLDRKPREYAYAWKVGSGKITTPMAPSRVVIIDVACNE